MTLDIDDLSYFINSLNKEEFNLLLELINERAKQESNQEKTLTKEKPRFLWNND